MLPLNDPVTPRNRQVALSTPMGRRGVGRGKERDSEYAQVRRRIMMPYVLSGKFMRILIGRCIFDNYVVCFEEMVEFYVGKNQL